MIIIVSSNYAPAHFYSIYSLILYFKSIGRPFELKLNKKYFTYHPLLRGAIQNTKPEQLHFKNREYIFVNSSIKHVILMLVCLLQGSATSVFMHEPMRNFKKWLNLQSGLIKKFKIILLKVINDLHMLLSRKVYVFSINAYNEVPEIFKSRVVQRRLLFPDLLNLCPNIECKEVEKHDKFVVSYIGTISRDHNYENFLKLAETYKNSFKDCRVIFKVFTRSVEGRELPFIDSLTQGAVMSDTALIQAFTESDLVWCHYSSANQSGVIPMALMCSTVPIVSTVFNDKILSHEQNCFIVADQQITPEKLNKCLHWYKSHKSKMKFSAIATFDEFYSYKNFEL